jgi:hypothetical protein
MTSRIIRTAPDPRVPWYYPPRLVIVDGVAMLLKRHTGIMTESRHGPCPEWKAAE